MNHRNDLCDKVEMQSIDVAALRHHLAAAQADNERLAAQLSSYGDAFCEHSLSEGLCGTLPDTVCRGCPARNALAAHEDSKKGEGE